MYVKTQDRCFFRTCSDYIKESFTLDLVNDCLRFITSHFEIISASCPHIYHSALVLTPKSSIVWNLYGAYAGHFTRVVYGGEASLDSASLATGTPFMVKLIVWSPCNRYLAIRPPDLV